METLPEYAQKNREAWTKMSEDYLEPGHRAWSEGVIRWGIWGRLESEIQALGDLGRFMGLDVIELGCGTGYISSWLARLGARPVGIDVTPKQLEKARAFQAEFAIEFPLIEGNAENVPFDDATFDFAISEYGASIWCDPYRWIPEAARLLRPGGQLVFLRNGTIGILCTPEEGVATDRLLRPLSGLKRLEWSDDGSVEFHISAGEMVRLLRNSGFEILNLIEIYPAADAAETRFPYVTLDWAKQWPSEEIWVVRKRE